MICWSCERATEPAGEACTRCGAVLPPVAGADHFQVLGLERRYAIDLAAAESRFRELSRRLHPDRFAKADPRARKASLGRTVQLNEAWRTLKDPVRRAEYLLAQAGQTVAAEAPPALLMEMLELREALGEARDAGDDAQVRALAGQMRRRAQAALERVAQSLGIAFGETAAAGGAGGAGPVATAADGGGDAPGRALALADAGRELTALRYFRRFLDEVAVHEDEAAAAMTAGAAESASHA